MNFDLIIIVPFCDYKHINYLINSLNSYNRGLNTHFVGINQTKSDLLDVESTSNFNSFVFLYSLSKLNSSEARNVGLDYIRANKIQYKYIVFLDDDSSLDNIFFEFVSSKCSEYKEEINFVCDVKLQENVKLFYRGEISTREKFLNKYFFDSIGAVNILLTSYTINKVGIFDEKYGVGSYYGAGEDGDFFLRAIDVSSFYYSKLFYTIHPSINFKSNVLDFYHLNRRNILYSRGTISVLCKHNLKLYAFYIALRALGASFKHLIFNPKLSLLYFVSFFYRIGFLFRFVF